MTAGFLVLDVLTVSGITRLAQRRRCGHWPGDPGGRRGRQPHVGQRQPGESRSD